MERYTYNLNRTGIDVLKTNLKLSSTQFLHVVKPLLTVEMTQLSGSCNIHSGKISINNIH